MSRGAQGPTEQPAGKARRIASRTIGGSKQTLYALQPPLEVPGDGTHRRVIVASAFGETHVFPTSGRARVLAALPGTLRPRDDDAAALALLGYEKRGVA